MKVGVLAKPPLLLSFILFSVIFMTFWWRNLFHEYLNYYITSELYKLEIDIRHGINNDKELMQSMVRNRKVTLVNSCNKFPCVRYGKKYLQIHQAFQEKLSQTRNTRWNMIWWETSFLIALLVTSGGFLLVIYFRDRARENEAEQFAAMAAHELKHPISSLSLLLQSLKRKSIPKGKLNYFIEKGLSEINSLRDQIEILLKLKDNAGYHKNEVQAYNVLILIREISEYLTVVHKFDAERTKIAESAENLFTTVNRESLRLILKNILENSLLYSGEKVIIKTDRDFTGGIIQISDQGLGFTREEKNKAGRMFFRSSRYTIQNIKGSGLGLFTVFKLARLTGIKIDFLSEGENKGTSFRVKLP